LASSSPRILRRFTILDEHTSPVDRGENAREARWGGGPADVLRCEVMRDGMSTDAPDKPRAESADESRPNILIVDDVPDNLRLLSELLRTAGYTPRPVSSGRAALKAVRSVPIDLVLLDIHMPEMTGFEVCSRLKADGATRDIPVIFLSADTETDHKVEAFRRGGVDYVSKPFEFEEVRARVDTHLRIRRLQREQRSLLERTLSSSIRTLMECLHIAAPNAFERSRFVRECVVHLAERLHVTEPWTYRVAGALAFIGCLALPDDVVRAAFAQGPRPAEVEEAFRRHADIGRRLLAEIPRLERVAEVIGAQYGGTLPADVSVDTLLAARVLRVAQAYAAAVFDGASPAEAQALLRHDLPKEHELIPMLEGLRPEHPIGDGRRGHLTDLSVGCTILTPVKTTAGALLLGKGEVLSQVALLRLAEFLRSKRIEDSFLFEPPKRNA